MQTKMMKLAGVVAVGLAALNGAAVPTARGVAVITAGEAHTGTILLISSGLLFMVRRKTRRK